MPSSPGPQPRPSGAMLSTNPPITADSYLPALWVPLGRLLRAGRRYTTLVARLPADTWDAPSACPGWRRSDVLAHVASDTVAAVRPARAVLAGAPMHESRPDMAAPDLTQDVWNAREVERRRNFPLPALLAEFEAAIDDLLALLVHFDATHLLQPFGYAPHALGGVERLTAHLNAHANDIVNGPRMLG